MICYDPEFVRHAPRLSEADVFHSNTAFGKLAYTAPALDALTGATKSYFNTINSLTVDTSVLTMAPGTEVWIYDNQCKADSKNSCRLQYARWSTPTIYYLMQPVVYYTQVNQIIVNPWNNQNGLRRVGTDLPFESITIDGTRWDTTEFYDVDSTLSGWTKNFIAGEVGNQKPNANSEVKMRWISGYAAHADYSMKVCAHDDGTNCYKAKTVPLITSISQSSGSMEGG